MPKLYAKRYTLNAKSAFTLIELLVVMGIIAVLAGAIMYSTSNAREKGRDSQRKTSLEAFRTAAVAYYTDNQEYPELCDNPNVAGNPNSLPTCSIITQNSQDWTFIDSSTNPEVWQNTPGFSSYFQDGKVPLDVNQKISEVPTKLASITNKIASWFTSPSTKQSNPTGQVAGITTATFTLEDGTHDVKRENTDCLVNSPVDAFGKPYPYMGDNGLRELGLHYTNVTIPAADIPNITNAKLVFNPRDDSGWGGSTNLNVHVKISAQKNTLTPPVPPCLRTPSATNWGGITRTAYANWDPPAWTGYGDDGVGAGHTYQAGIETTTDEGTYTNGKTFTDVIKEVLQQGAWSSGGPGSITIFIEDNGSASGAGRGPFAKETYNWDVNLGAGGDGVGPKLQITYNASAPTPTIVSCEAEATGTNVTNTAGTNGSFTQIGEPVTASNSAYMSSNASDNASASESVGPVNGSANGGLGGSIQYKVYPPTAGTYYFFARVKYPPSVSSHNSFWMQINGSGPSGATSFYKVGNDNTSGWHWINFRNGDTTSDVISATLSAGENTIKIWSREDGTQIDKFELKTESSIPSNNGDATSNCSGGPTTQCNDGVDNADPEDTLIDLADPGCVNASDNDETNSPPPTYQCSDSLDNDGDAYIDYPNDPGCTNISDDDETNTPPSSGPTGDDECEGACKMGYQLSANKKQFKIWIFLENDNDPNRADGPTGAGPNAVCTGTTAELASINPAPKKSLYCIESPPI